MTRRRALTLVIVLVCLALASALVSPVVVLSGLDALESVRRANGQQHELAVDSVILLLPSVLAENPQLALDLDRENAATLTLQVGEVIVVALIQDDTAKLPVSLVSEADDVQRTREALAALQAGLPLANLAPGARLRESARVGQQSGLRWTGCLDDLFDAPVDAALYGRPDSPATWARYITPIGRSVNLQRACAVVLEGTLADLRPGLGLRLAELRARFPKATPDELLAMEELPDSVRREATRRVTADARRLSLLVRTRIDNDVRQRYLICTLGEQAQVIVDLEVAP